MKGLSVHLNSKKCHYVDIFILYHWKVWMLKVPDVFLSVISILATLFEYQSLYANIGQ